MARRFLASAALAFVLLLGALVFAGRLLGRLGPAGLDLSGREPASLTAAEKAVFAGLTKPLHITYFVSDRRRMPSDFKRVEPAVRALLEKVRRQNPDRIELRFLDPDLDPERGAPFAATKKVSPISVRRVAQDESSEVKIWSSLVVSYGNQPEALLQGITEAHLPHLRALLLQQLKALEDPPKPVYAVAAPADFKQLREELKAYGDVVEADPMAGNWPKEADVLLWVRPDAAGPAQAQALRAWLDSGKSAVLAGGAFELAFRQQGSRQTFQAALTGGMDRLLQPYGLSLQPDLLLDNESERQPVPIAFADGKTREVNTPFILRVAPINYDLRRFFLIHIGALFVPVPSAISVDERAAENAGYRPETIATSGTGSAVLSLPEKPFNEGDLGGSLAVPKQPIFVTLVPDDPMRGQLFVAGAAGVFADPLLKEKEPNKLLVRILARSLASPERLVLGRVPRPEPRRVPDLPPGARVGWRLFVVFLAPALLAVVLVIRFRDVWRWSLTPGLDPKTLGTAAAAALALLLVLRAGRGFNARLDLTQERVNSPSPQAEALLAKRPADLDLAYAVSDRGVMPAPLKTLEASVRGRLNDLGLSARIVRPEDLDAAALKPLADAGLKPFETETVVEDRVVAQQLWSGLVLSAGGRSTAIPRLEPRNLDHLEFLLVGALSRLEGKAPPKLAVASDLPRLSPAEAFIDYQQKNFTAPSGSDVYSRAKQLFQDYGYALSFVDLKAPAIPQDAAALFWFQPRFDVLPLLRVFSEHLARGGKSVVALQHFNIQQRQYRGLAFKTVYWPQPQYQDLERWLRVLGVEQVKEILLDRTFAPLSLETQVNRAARREYEAQQVAQPFLIRAVADNMDKDSVITARLGDQLFVWGNRFKWEPQKLAELGLTARALIRTSPRAWSFDWKGGWLPDDIAQAKEPLPEPAPLMLDLEGAFPDVEFRSPGEGKPEMGELKKKGKGPAGRLLLIGSSEMFKNAHLYEPGFRHDQLLLNSAALLAYGPELAALQARERAPRGFPFQTPARKALWRLLVIILVPALLLGASLRLLREKPGAAA